jgi:hypothetical protein
MLSLHLRALLRVVPVLAAAGCRRGGPPPPAPQPVRDTTPAAPAIQRLRAVTLPFGDDAVTVSGRSDQRVEVSVAGAHAMTLAFALPSVDEFLPLATRLAQRQRRRRERPSLMRALIDEPGGDGGALSLSRRLRGRTLTYRLFFADAAGGGFPITVSQVEARAVLQAMREAADAVRPPAPPRKRPARRRPATNKAPTKAPLKPPVRRPAQPPAARGSTP